MIRKLLQYLKLSRNGNTIFVGTLLIIRTDQASLKYINEQRITEGVQHKLLIKLLSYDYKIEYKKSKENKAADALSQVPPNGQLFATTLIIPTWITNVVDSYATDTKSQELESQLRINSQAHPPYTLTRGILRYKNQILVGTSTDLRTRLQHSFHDSALGVHSGERATYQRAKQLFYWPGMKKDIISFVKHCPVRRTKLSTIWHLGCYSHFLSLIWLGPILLWILLKVLLSLRAKMLFGLLWTDTLSMHTLLP